MYALRLDPSIDFPADGGQSPGSTYAAGNTWTSTGSAPISGMGADRFSVRWTGILTSAAVSLTERTIRGIEANREMCEYWVERSAALATALAPQIGYARAAELSKQSVKENTLIRDLVRREHVLPDEQIDEVLDLRKMTEIGVPGGKGIPAGG